MLVFVVINTNIFFWWFSLSLFEDEFSLRQREWLVFILWFVTGIPLLLATADIVFQPWPEWVRPAGGILVVMHVSWAVWQGRGQDLVSSRRAIRIPFVFAANGWLLFIIVSEAVETGGKQTSALNAGMNSFEAFGILVLALWGMLWLSRMDSEIYFSPGRRQGHRCVIVNTYYINDKF